MTAVTLQETKCSDSILHVNNLQRQTYLHKRTQSEECETEIWSRDRTFIDGVKEKEKEKSNIWSWKRKINLYV